MLARLVDVRQEEVRGLRLSFAFFFCVMCSYFILRPLRDAMATLGDARSLSLAVSFTWTFGAMLVAVPVYSALVARYPRHQVLPLVYRTFLVVLLGFFALMKAGVAPQGVARAFFVWVSVYNLFVVSVFWSFMADLFVPGQGRRLFGFIAGGGTAGTIAGSLVTALLVKELGAENLLLLSALLLELSVWCVKGLARWAHAQLEERRRAREAASQAAASQAAAGRGAADPEAPVGGTVWAGLRLLVHSPFLLTLGAQTLLYAATSTFLYFQQQKLVAAAAAGAAGRAQLFASMDLAVQVLTLVLQMAVTGRVMQRAGLAVSLSVVPVVTGLGFLGLAAVPSLAFLTVFRSLRGATHYAFERPSRELLFTAVDREERYKAKSFIDTALYRASDLVGSWLQTGLEALGMAAAGVALAAVPLAGAWLGASLYLARRHTDATATGTNSPPGTGGGAPLAQPAPPARVL
jgi:AAA family ATP:ADP antiporter